VESPFLLSRADLLADPLADGLDDVRFPASLARAVIGAFSVKGDVVLDPFAGYGTTAVAAVSMGRRTIAVEILAERIAHIRRRLGSDTPTATVIDGDARHLERLVTDRVDLCLTSPPYMAAVDHPENPLTGYRTHDGDYATYLVELEDVFRQVARLLRPGGHFVLNVAEPRQAGDGVTPLVADLRTRCLRYFTLRQEVVLTWDHPPPGLTNDRLLVFDKPMR
jgi:tRNA G10  N-methylase Trm11